MGSVNLHIIVGSVGKDPEIRKTKTGKSICELSVATNDGEKGPDGSPLTNWHKVICFDKVADFVGAYVVKGTMVSVQGPVKLRNFEGKDGNTVYIKETKGFKVELLAKGRPKGSSTPYDASGGQQEQAPQGSDPFSPPPAEDDLPF